MGSSKKKTTTTNDPASWAKPYIQQGLNNTQQVFDQQQPILNQLGQVAQSGATSLAQRAFSPDPYVTNAQNMTTAIGNGALYGTNPGAATYARLQQPANDPSMGLLTGFANGAGSVGGTNPGNALAQQVAKGGNNPATALATNVAQGGYLNAQPSAGLYDKLINGDPAVNPFADAIAKQGEDAATRAVNARFAAAGMGEGLSTPYADLLTRNVQDAGNQVRYQAYNDAANRQLQAAGQSDAAWSGERGRMDASTGLLSSDYNAQQGRILDAAGLLSNNYNAGQDRAVTQRAQNLAAAQALGSQFNAGEDRALDAAKSADTVQNSNISQILAALGLTGDLRNADYAGIAPALSLLDQAATIPWTGVNAYNGGIRTNSSGYGTSTTKSSPSLLDSIGSALDIGQQGATLFSDRRLKTAIRKVGVMADGLGVYIYRYIWGGPEQRGVMADEVAKLRPWALGPEVFGFSTVNYGAL